MTRTILSAAVLFFALIAGLKLLHDSQSQPPPAAQPEVSRRLAPRPTVATETTTPTDSPVPASEDDASSPRAARAPQSNQSSTNLKNLPCDDEHVCCGLDTVPPPERLIAAGALFPIDHLGRLNSPGDIDALPIPVPVPTDELRPRAWPVRMATFIEDVAADKKTPPMSDDNEPDENTTVEKNPDESPAAGAEPKAKLDAPPPVRVAPVANCPPELLPLRDKIRTCLAHYYFRRQESTNGRSPWGIMHVLISYGVDAQVLANNRPVNAIGWLAYNGSCKGQNLFFLKQGELQTRIGPGVQGHSGQFLAMLAQSRVSAEFPMLVEGKRLKVQDLIEFEQRDCKPATELTFKLIAFAHYLPSDATWRSDQGEDWDIPRVIKEELKQPVVGAACGGTHRLMGLSYAVHRREARGEPVDGQWLRARHFTAAYQEYLLRLQNPDGSFSTDWFKGRGDNGKPTRKLETTGHMLEWLVYSLPQERLTDPRVVRAVDFLASLLLSDPNGNWSIGPQGHGLHALALYDERMFGGHPGARSDELAGSLKPLRR